MTIALKSNQDPRMTEELLAHLVKYHSAYSFDAANWTGNQERESIRVGDPPKLLCTVAWDVLLDDKVIGLIWLDGPDDLGRELGIAIFDDAPQGAGSTALRTFLELQKNPKLYATVLQKSLTHECAKTFLIKNGFTEPFSPFTGRGTTQLHWTRE